MAKTITITINKYLFWAGIAAFIVIILGILSFFINYFRYLHRVHSTFENYYAFRGCVTLLQKTDTYGFCKLADGTAIKLVKFNGRWYLDGDLPVCLGSLCF